METKRVYRSSTNKVFAGVCGGIGEYFDVDPVIVRLIWVIVTFFSLGAGGVLGYIIAFAIIPEKSASGQEKEKENNGCLYVLLILVLAALAIPIIGGILGFIGYSFVSSAKVLSSMWGLLPSFNLPLVEMIFVSLSSLVGIAIIIVIIFLIKSIAKKDK